MKAFHHLRYKSDQRAIVVASSHVSLIHKKDLVFRYNVAWLVEDGFVDIVAEAWDGNSLSEGIKKFSNLASSQNVIQVKSIVGQEGIDRARRSEDKIGLWRLE